MKIKSYENALVNPQVVAEFEALHMEIAELKEKLVDLQIVVARLIKE
jgi:hypothetical protein